VVRRFKAGTAYAAHAAGIVEFEWQEQYWDGIIRSERHLHNIRCYILNNPAKWTLDGLYRAEACRLKALRAHKSSKGTSQYIPLDELPF
jgi:hypothetical protein